MFCCPVSDWIRILSIIGTIIKTIWDTRDGERVRRARQNPDPPEEFKKNITE